MALRLALGLARARNTKAIRINKNPKCNATNRKEKKKKQIEKGQVRGFSYTLFNVLAKNAVKEERKKRKKDEIEERKSSAMLFSRIGLKELDDCTEDEGQHTQSILG